MDCTKKLANDWISGLSIKTQLHNQEISLTIKVCIMELEDLNKVFIINTMVGFSGVSVSIIFSPGMRNGSEI